MALKGLLVYVDQTENSLLRLRLAADLVIRHSSHLTALYVWIGANPPRSFDQRIEASFDAAAEHLQSTLTALASESGLQAERSR
jgi:hypothetical protein